MGKKIISEKEVEHVAKLAKLGIKKEKLIKFQKQLSSILQFVDQLSDLNTDQVIPTSQITGLENVFREDEVEKSLPKEDILKNAPRRNGDYFMVDAVLEGE